MFYNIGKYENVYYFVRELSKTEFYYLDSVTCEELIRLDIMIDSSTKT